MQLDSWFYPKGSGAEWTNNGAGIYRYEAAAPPFMSGLSRFQQNLGVPLVTHARWIDPSSPYRTLYKMSGNVVTDPAYWETVAAYLANSGVATFEQDWLDDKAHTDFNLTDGAAFLDNMAASMARRNLTMQYCMAAARHFLQRSKYSNLTTIRTSGDHLQRDRWTDFLYASRLGSALGAWPFTDNFMSTETSQLLLATLSAGPVGIGDQIGSINGAEPAPRGEAGWRDREAGRAVDSYGSQLLEHGAQHRRSTDRLHLVGFRRTAHQLRFRVHTGKECAGEDQSIGFRNQRAGVCLRLLCRHGPVDRAADAIQKQISGDALYLVLAPVGPSGIADSGRCGPVRDHGQETRDGIYGSWRGAGYRELRGRRDLSDDYRILARCADRAGDGGGSIGQVTYNAATHLFRVPVMAGSIAAPPSGSKAAARTQAQRRRAEIEAHRSPIAY